jgi:5'-methylthioadenosine phosphorylase
VDQFIDRTTQRVNSFFGDGVVAHVSMADPVCARLGSAIVDAADEIAVVRGGTCVVIEGPQFSTRAESRLYQRWECDLVGMTALPEARLARESEMCYAMLALVTDYDCWHSGHASVTVDEVMATMAANVGAARAIIQRLPARLPERGACADGCDRALDAAIVTPPDSRDPATVERLRTIAGRVLSPDPPA